LEALACREALALVADLNLGDITVASDCLEVVKGLHDQYLGLSSHILVEIKDTARARGGVCFRHEGRKMNTEAHNLGRFASSLPQGRHVWLNHVEGLNFTFLKVFNKVVRSHKKKSNTAQLTKDIATAYQCLFLPSNAHLTLPN
jgi:hypothetical protein